MRVLNNTMHSNCKN